MRHKLFSLALTAILVPLLSPAPAPAQTTSSPVPGASAGTRRPTDAPTGEALLSETATCSLKFGGSAQDRCKLTLTDAGLRLEVMPSGTAEAVPSAGNRAPGSQRLLIPAASLLGLYARPPLPSSAPIPPTATASPNRTARSAPPRSPQPAAPAAPIVMPDVTLEIDFLVDRPIATGNLSNSLRVRVSQPFALALQNQMATSPASSSTDRALRQRLSPTISDIGDRTSQLQRLLDTRTCIRCELSGVDLGGVDLSGANLEGTHLEGANLSGANLNGAYLVGASLINANLNGADLSNAHLSFASLQAANLGGANLNTLKAQSALFQSANFSSANLQGADLTQATLTSANLTSANLGLYRREPPRATGTTVEVSTNSSAVGTTSAAVPTLYVTILRNANLSRANLRGVDLQQALLDRTNLREANLTNARLPADLRSANLCGAILPDGKPSRQGC